MKISELNPGHLTREQMTKLIFDGISDDGQNGDCIFVFGSNKSTKYRVPKAVELYMDARAPKILFSGGMIWEGQHNKPEALVMKEKSIELGVPRKDILTERESKHTKENILASLVVLDRAFTLHRMKRLLVVTSAYHMRRAYLTLRTYMPQWIEYSLCPADDLTTKQDNWWLHAGGTKRITTESKKIIEYVKNGAIEDDEIM